MLGGPGLGCGFSLVLTVLCWACFLTTLNLSFLVRKMGMLTPTSQRSLTHRSQPTNVVSSCLYVDLRKDLKWKGRTGDGFAV